MQQRVEIIKVLYRGAETLILDEPTASLTPQEIEGLMEIAKKAGVIDGLVKRMGPVLRFLFPSRYQWRLWDC